MHSADQSAPEYEVRYRSQSGHYLP